jgi:2-dehydro-3-deoxyphosphogalactonate aldolase
MTRSITKPSSVAATFDAGSWPTALPLVAILRGVEPHEAAAHADLLLEAGFDCIEVPTNSPGWADSVRAIGAVAAGRALVGAGTVLYAAHLDMLIAAGGRMAVSPHTDAALIKDAAGRGLFVLPGAMTVSEVFSAHRAGAHAVKLFPAAQLGTGYVKALRAVLPSDLSLLAVGGVTPDNLVDFLRAGCVGAGLGGDLYRPGQSARETAARARDFVAAWHAAQPA